MSLLTLERVSKSYGALRATTAFSLWGNQGRTLAISGPNGAAKTSRFNLISGAVLLDEIAGGLTEHEAKALVDELKRIKSRGVTMIWIEHVVHALLSLADTLYVINFGCKLAEGEPREVMANPEVRRVYMGMEA